MHPSQESVYFDFDEDQNRASQIITSLDLESKFKSKLKRESDISLQAFSVNQLEYEDEEKSHLYQPLLNQVADVEEEEKNIPIKQVNLKKYEKQKLAQTKKSKWNWDTTGALIRLMKRRAVTRKIANIYIWVLMFMRVFYAYIMIDNIIELHEKMRSFIFFWIVLIVYIAIRFLFMAIVYKIIRYGGQSHDKKIRIVYETYIQMIEDLVNSLLELQKSQTLTQTQQTQIKLVQSKIIKKQVLMILIPAEFSFLLIKYNQPKLNGYYQAQNFIMKSLEVFFFMPFLIYFIRQNLMLGELVQTIPNLSRAYLSTLVVTVDLASFIGLNAYLLTNNQSK